jgi:hypothetical protein
MTSVSCIPTSTLKFREMRLGANTASTLSLVHYNCWTQPSGLPYVG